jgi:hypothetical protein
VGVRRTTWSTAARRFRLAFAFDTKAEPTLVYKNEIATTYMAQPAGEGEAPVSTSSTSPASRLHPGAGQPAYIAAISTFNPLPGELTSTSSSRAQGQGLDVSALLPRSSPISRRTTPPPW